MKAGNNQPIKLADWCDENAQAVRNPDDPSKIEETKEPQMEGIKLNELSELKFLEALRLLEQHRPLRLLPVEKEAIWTKADADFFKHAREEDLKII